MFLLQHNDWGLMEINYKNSLLFQMISTAKYFEKLFEQYIKELNTGISPSEHFALCVIKQTENCCQRDLAKIILKDRANTGKLVASLEEKGYISIELKTKDNRPVKILTITQEGKTIVKKVGKHIETILQKIIDEISLTIINQTKENLKIVKTSVEKIVKTNI